MHHAFFIKHGCYRSPFGAILAILAILRQLRRKCCQDSETNRIIKNQHETQMSHSIKPRTRAKTQFTSPLPSHDAVALFQFQMITLYLRPKRRKTRLTYNCAHLRSTKEILTIEYFRIILEKKLGEIFLGENFLGENFRGENFLAENFFWVKFFG